VKIKEPNWVFARISRHGLQSRAGRGRWPTGRADAEVFSSAHRRVPAVGGSPL